jgi:hypothetical protein
MASYSLSSDSSDSETCCGAIQVTFNVKRPSLFLKGKAICVLEALDKSAGIPMEIQKRELETIIELAGGEIWQNPGKQE